jgi:hypothetical protein
MARGMTASMEKSEKKSSCQREEEHLERIVVTVPDHLYRAYHRCSWILINETGKSQTQIMEEMVRDFLTKHGC